MVIRKMITTIVLMVFAATANSLRDPFYFPAFNPLSSLIEPEPFEPYPWINTKICEKVDNIPGLHFPPYSQLPKDRIKEGYLLKESVRQTTYKCRDKEHNVFYMLRSNAEFATTNIVNKQNTASYYDSEGKPILDADLKVDHQKLWEFLEQEDAKAERRRRRPSSAFSYDPYMTHSYLQDTWKEVENSKPKCTPRETVSGLTYPEIDFKDLADSKLTEKKNETFFCINPKTGETYLLLKTIISATQPTGGVISRYQSAMYPADKDGKPLDGKSRVGVESGQTTAGVTTSSSTSSFLRASP